MCQSRIAQDTPVKEIQEGQEKTREADSCQLNLVTLKTLVNDHIVHMLDVSVIEDDGNCRDGCARLRSVDENESMKNIG
jgi:hypothetical protein